MGEVRVSTVRLISEFKGPYGFLSNFSASSIDLGYGWTFPTAEHAFQALKAAKLGDAAAIAAAPSATTAKALGRKVTLVPLWDENKFATMTTVVHEKFAQNPHLERDLLDTGEAILVEGNGWHDQVWGDCGCPQHKAVPGINALGAILMAERARLRILRAK